MQKLRFMTLKFFELSRKVRVLFFCLKLQKNCIDGLTDDIGNLGKFAKILQILDNPEVSRGNGPTLSSTTICGLAQATGQDLLVMFCIEQFLCLRRECHIICLTSHALLFDRYAERLHSLWLTVIFSTHIDATCQLGIEVNDSRLRSPAVHTHLTQF